MPALDLIAFATFAFSALITPGPNNMMVAASGMNFGFARTRAHILGICVGFASKVFLVGIGLGSILHQYPTLHIGMRYFAFAFLCWIAWRIAFADIGDGGSRNRPMSFTEAGLFQWINPKAWAIAGGAVTAFMPIGGNAYQEALWISVIFLLLSLPCVSVWALFGASIGKVLKKSRILLRGFNVAMALLLLVAMSPTLFI